MRHTFRYLVTDLATAGDEVVLGATDAHHLTRVVRRGVGEQVELFDGVGLRVRGTVSAVSDAGVRVRVGVALPPLAPAPVRLVVGTMEAARLDLVAEKAAELGVAELIVIAGSRSRRAPDAAAWQRRAARLERVIGAACRQCGRGRLMPVRGLVPFAAIVGEDAGSDRILIDPRGTSPLHAALADRDPVAPVTLAIGPDAGFAADEVAAATGAGWSVAQLGPAVLRAETAALAAATLACAAAGGLG